MTEPVNDLSHIDRMTRIICQESCAFRGEPPCWLIEGTWPNPDCKEPGCVALANAAIDTDLETELWSIIDNSDLTNLPSNICAAVKIIVQQAAKTSAALEKLKKERDDSRFFSDRNFNDCKAAEDALERMREALMPFSEAAKSCDESEPDNRDIWEHSAAMDITIGDLRRAALAQRSES